LAERVALFKEAMTLLLQHGPRVEELAGVAGLEAPSIEVTATKVDEKQNVSKLSKLLH
jgi:hypothetical protein